MEVRAASKRLVKAILVIMVNRYDSLMDLQGSKIIKIFRNNLQFSSFEMFNFWRPEARDGPGRQKFLH